MIFNNIFAVALVTVVSVLYGMQALSLLHAVINIRQINGSWLLAIYLLMFFIPHLVLLLIFAAFADPWLDIRRRVSQKV